MTQLEYCTYFDGGYLPRALVLHDSLVAARAEFRLTALCLDDEAHRAVEALDVPTLRPVRLSVVEDYDPALLEAKRTRSKYEYYFTVGPSLIAYVLESLECDRVTYLDADMRFYADPSVLEEEAAKASTVIVGHRFPERLRHLEKTGRYNVAWVEFSNDADGTACLEWWRERCLEWCFDRVDGDRYADQKYLDGFAERFGGVHVLEHPGADVAPWNAADPPLVLEDGRYTVGGSPLVFFHFQGFRLLGRRFIDPNLVEYGNRADAAIRALYRQYADELVRHSTSASVSSPRRGTSSRTLRDRLALMRRVARRDLILRRPVGG